MDYAKLASLGIDIDRGRLGEDHGFEIQHNGISYEPETFFKEFGAERPIQPVEDLTRLNPKQSAISARYVRKMWSNMTPAQRRAAAAKRRRAKV